MKKLIKLSLVLLIVMLFLPTCMKNNTTTTCLVIDATQNKRKVVFTYTNNTYLTRITDYSDSANILTASRYNFSYNSYGQVSAITEMHESGLFDSISFEFVGISKIREKQYIQTDGAMVLNYSRNFILDMHGFIASDTLYGLLPARKSMILSAYTTYAYDASYNLASIENFSPDGSTNFSITYSYINNLIQNNSYKIARFTCIGHYGTEYQYIFPQMYKFPLKTIITTNGTTTTNIFTYALDTNNNPVSETMTVTGCPDCDRITSYKYGCY
jgi:hypothetical protein